MARRRQQVHWTRLAGMVVPAIVVLVAAGCSDRREPLLEDPSARPRAGEVMTNSVGMTLVYVPAGEFLMGNRSSVETMARQYGAQPEYFANEFPRHRVILRSGFWMGESEVTQGQYKTVMEAEPWLEKPYVEQAGWNPAVFVSWEDAILFCRRLSAREGRTYGLPTEAQWEYACRAGTDTEYSFGAAESTAEDYAWFKGNTVGIGEPCAHPVALLKPNAFGLYDLHGNVWEWCRDYYDGEYYGKSGSPAVDPENIQPMPNRVLRGGCWYYEPQYGRSSYRSSGPASRRNARIGFRVILLHAQPDLPVCAE
jgi:formylglycine-generating enzyme required for sulfatase activity